MIAVTRQSVCKYVYVANAKISLARLPYARSVLLWLRSSARTLNVAALLWEVARKLVFKLETK